MVLCILNRREHSAQLSRGPTIHRECGQKTVHRLWRPWFLPIVLVLVALSFVASVALASQWLEANARSSLVVCPGACGQNEALNIEGVKVNTSTNVTLNVRNVGSLALSLVAYYVKDSQGNQYSNTNWLVPAFAQGTLVTINLLIDGKVFTFHSGNSYTIELVTSRNNIFTVPLTA
jgi:hypothetical protein